MRTGKNTGRKELALAVLAALVLFFCFFGAASARAETYQLSEDTSKWAGTLTNLKFDPVIKPNFDLRYDGKTFIGIPIPTLVFSVKLGLGVESDFDLDIRQGTMQGITEESWITENTPGLSHEKISNNITDYLPTLFTVGVKIETYLRVGATAPVKLKGKFKNNVMIELSSDTGVHKSRENSVEFTSVRPQTPNKKVFFYVGTDTSEFIGIGEINFLLIKFGPLLDGGVSISNGALGFATLEKDQIDLSNVDEDPGHYIGSIHTCLENGKDGCVTGSWRMMDQMTASLRIHLVVEIFWQKLTIYEHTWPLDEAMNRTDLLPFVQSLTWGEPAKILQEKCDHIVYQVPAIVYYDHEHKIVARNWNSPIHPTDNVQVDPNVRSLTSRVPRNGQTNLFLPWKDGRYTLTTDNGVFAATEAQPSYMVRGKNAQVPLVLESNEKRVFTAKKEWDIDMEDKDRPKSIQVVLQRSSYNDGKRIMHEYYQRDPSILWKSVDIIELNEENNWTAQFDPVPLYELDEYGKTHKYKYRVRELREATEEEQENSLEDANKRVVPNRWDLDNIRLVDVLKDKLTSFDTYWSLPLTEDGIKAWLAGYATDALFHPPEVAFTVPEYTNLVGETVEEHETRYQVEYEEEEGDEDENPRKTTVTIKNTAILSINIYKRWIGLGNTTSDDIPDTVYIALLSRPQQSYLEHLPATVQRYAGLWLPVFKPLSGDNVNLLSIVGLDFLAKLDVAGLLKIPTAVAKVEKPEDGSNPLTAWKCGFVVKKYGALGIPGIPVEFEGAELSSVVIQDLIKFLTGLDIPISIGIQGFVTVPGKAYQIPVLDKDWEKTSNIMNIQASPDEPSGDDPGAVAIGGAKHWVNDQPSDRPESITLHIKDGETKIADLVLKRSVNGYVSIINKDSGETIGNYPAGNDENTWIWALKQSNVPGVTLDPNKTYTVTEDPVEGYLTSVDGHEITNTWVKGEWPTLLFRKIYDGRNGPLQREVVFKVTAPDQDPWLIPLYELVKKDGVFEAKLKLPEIGGADPMEYCSRISVEELPIFSQGYEVTRSGPDPVWDSSGLTYVFTITNRASKDYELVIRKEWTDDSEGDRPESVSVKLYRDGVYWQTVSLSKTRNWSWEASGDVLRKADGTMYEIKAEEEVPEGYSSTLSRENSVTSAGRHRTTITLTNKKKPTGNITVTGKKTWVDDNTGSTRPEKITIHVRNSNNETVKDLEVKASDNWTWSVGSLPEKDENGNALTYYVTEDRVAVSGAADTYYTTTYETPSYKEADQTWTCNITNTHPNKTTLIKVEKVWNDGNNQHGQRPESVRIRIYETPSGGTKTKLREVELDARSGWQTAFMTEKKENAVYSLEEDRVDGYDTADPVITQSGDTVSCSVTNTLQSRITVKKIWEDENDAWGIRPAKILLVLRDSRGRTITKELNAEIGWQYEFTENECPLWDHAGNPIFYTLTEDFVPGYTGVVIGSEREGFVITNTRKPRIQITKTWDDEGKKQFRPSSVKLYLKRTDTGAVYPQTINNPGGTADSWTLYVNPDICPVYNDNDQLIPYELTEEPVPNYRTGSITGNAKDGFTVPNTLKRHITITKVWNDDNNQAGDRPTEVTVHLQSTDPSVTVDKDLPITGSGDTWTLELAPAAYPVYKDDGTPIPYELTEYTIPKYKTGEVTGDAQTGFTVTNTPTERVKIRKVWNDNNNEGDTRPTSVTVYVKRSDDPSDPGVYVTLNASNNWSWSLDPDVYPIYENGQMVPYTLNEDETVHENYETAIVGNAEEGYTVINSLKDRLTLTKRWVDSDPSGRPDEISVFLQRRGERTPKEVVLEKSENWTAVLHPQDYPTIGEYTVTERDVPNGYAFSSSERIGDAIVVTNIQATMSVSVRKEWLHGANPEHQRPGAATVRLKLGTDVIGEVTLNAQNNWQYTFDDLPRLNDGLSYTVEEVNVPQGYRSSVERNSGDGKTEYTLYTITNIYETQTLEVPVSKVWEDNNSSRRPAEVKVKIYATSDVSKQWEATLNADNNWSHTFTELPIYYDPNQQNPITYDVEELNPPEGYTVTKAGNQDQGFTITNTLPQEITIRKVWIDGNYEGRPDSVTIYVKKPGATDRAEFTLEKTKDWKITLDKTEYPVKVNGQTVVYEVTEEPINGYTCRVSGDAESGYTVTNTRATMGVAVYKDWKHGANPVAQRPSAVKVQLKKGTTVLKTVTLNEANHWQYYFDNLPYLNESTEEYTVEEVDVPAGYTATYTHTGNGKTGPTTYTITNTYITQKIAVRVSKVWDDVNPSRRPEKVQVRIYATNDTTKEWKEWLSADNNWSHTFTDLPIYYDETLQNPITYDVEELNPPADYTVSTAGDQERGFTITNTLTNRITIIKVWNDDHDEGGYRPDSVTVRLRDANGDELVSRVLNQENNWECVLDPRDYPDAASLTEDPVPGYSSAVTGSVTDGFVVTNTLKRKMTIKKVWVDGNYSGRPTSVTVKVKKQEGGAESIEEVTLTKESNWTCTLDPIHFPVDESHTYSLEEVKINGYTSRITGDAENGFTVTNTRALMNVTVHKTWDHGANPEEQRPSAVRVQLRKGNTVLQTVTLNAAKNWQYTFEYLDFLHDGSEYTVEEVNIPAGYIRTVERTSGDGKTGNTEYTIKNTYVTRTRNVKVTKVWDDDGEIWRPEAVTVRIQAENDSSVFEEVTLNEANNWSHTFRNLRFDYPQQPTQEITYKVTEVNPPVQYDVSVTGNQENGFTVTNTLKKINIRVNKIWDDDNNALGNRPEWVQIALRGDGGAVLSSYLAPDRENKWTCLFENLPRYEDDGQGISYSLVEYDVPGYTDSWVYAFDPATNTGTFTLTNKASQERINLVIQKQWAGEGEWREEYRPSEVKVTIAGGGKEYPVTLKASEGWKATLTDLPRYVNGKEANYFLNEWDVNGYWASAEMSGPVTVGDVTTFTYTLTNTLITTDIPVTKYWLDEETSHPPVTFVLYSNREVADEDIEVGRITMTEADAVSPEPGSPWRKTFTNLPVYTAADGRAILYTLKEEPVEGHGEPLILRQSRPGSDDEPGISTSFSVYNYLLPRSAQASVVKFWEDGDNALGIRPDEVITHLWNGDEEVAEILVTGEDGSVGEADDLPMTDEKGRKITYTLTEEALRCYDSEIQSMEVEMFGYRFFLFFVTNTLRDDACALTYDPNGGILEGSTEPLIEGHRKGDTVQIHRAPVRDGYVFLYWKGSEYYPGDEYTVTGNHTFTAQWVKEDALDYKFTFTKRWSGQSGDSIDWTLYDAEDQVVRKRFNKKVVSDVEWQYTAWFDSPREHYLVEKPVPGYETIYRNVGKYADITDRCYSGGTIINYRAPNTGDESHPILWVALGAAGLLLLILLVINHRRKR